MASVNASKAYADLRTGGGSVAVRVSAINELRRSVLTALLWEDVAYESGSTTAKRITELVTKCKPEDVAALAIEARDKMYLRHLPLFLVRQLARVKGNGTLVAKTLAAVIQRPDELTEYVALYWQGHASGTTKRPEPLSAGSKRGLAEAFRKFKPETLSKYDRDGAVKLRDVLRLTHAKPKHADQGAAWKQTITRTLATVDTWETQLSAGKDKKDTFERLLKEDKLGGMAFLRNLRNMIESGVDEGLIRARFDGEFNKVLPFRFIAAAKHAPRFEPQIESAMIKAAAALPKLTGTTALIIDVSGSMGRQLSDKSEMTRLDVAASLAVLVREQCEHMVLIATAGSDASRGHKTKELPARRGMALRDGVKEAADTLGGGGIFLVQCLDASRTIIGKDVTRVIVLTDEQDCDTKLRPDQAKTFGQFNYLINISNERNGVGYGKQWTAHIDGWSERVLDFIAAAEVPDEVADAVTQNVQ